MLADLQRARIAFGSASGARGRCKLPGAPPWEELEARALTVRAGGVPIRVVSVDDLIRLKRAAAGLDNRAERKREEDLGDIAALTAILEQRRGAS